MEEPIYACTTKLRVTFEGQTIRAKRPGSKQLLVWEARYAEYLERLRAAAKEHGRFGLLSDVLTEEEVLSIAEILGAVVEGPFEVDGQRRDVSPSLLLEVWGPDHLYAVWTKLILASKPDFEKDRGAPGGEETGLVGKSEPRSSSPETAPGPTTAGAALPRRSWSAAAQELTRLIPGAEAESGTPERPEPSSPESSTP